MSRIPVIEAILQEIKKYKTNLFAAASKEINGNYDKTFNSLIDVYRAGNPYYKRRKENGQNTSSRSDTARNKKI